MELKSTDYARLIQYAAQRLHKVSLNKTQINKILFYVYGVYLAEKGHPLFSDDSPKAWPYGPVFPIVNKRIDTGQIITFTSEEISAFNQEKQAMSLIKNAVDRMYRVSAQALTKWSHQLGSPWNDTLYIRDSDGNVTDQAAWNTRIPDDVIKAYFSNPQNRFGNDWKQ